MRRAFGAATAALVIVALWAVTPATSPSARAREPRVIDAPQAPPAGVATPAGRGQPPPRANAGAQTGTAVIRGRVLAVDGAPLRRAQVTLSGAPPSASVTETQTPAGPTFEVASIKPNKSGEVGSLGWTTEGTQFRATNVTVHELLMRAFQLRQTTELIGGPSWIHNDRFDIVARLERPGSAVSPMVRALLADRFKLVTHQETRELPVYALVVARSDGRLGPKLSPSTCTAGRRAQADDTKPDCGLRSGPGFFAAGGYPIDLLANFVSQDVQRNVEDRTKLVGAFDIDLRWLPDAPTFGPRPNTPVDPGAPSIFTAVQEQLGLRLESTKGAVKVLVIDRVERPTVD